MTKRCMLLTGLVLCLTALTAPAQTTWYVDGPGQPIALGGSGAINDPFDTIGQSGLGHQ